VLLVEEDKKKGLLKEPLKKLWWSFLIQIKIP
jgi:hypothetical protein